MDYEAGRRRDKETPPVTMRQPTTVHDIPDQLLHRIVHRLRCHISIIRAAAVCKRWRRIASTRSIDSYPDWDRHEFFTCIGHYHVADPSLISSGSQRRRHIFVPISPSIKASHFSLDFLPRDRPWDDLVDVKGTLVLLASQRRDFFPDLVVCEPITQRYVRIHPIQEMKYFRCLGVFLGYRYNVISMCSFQVTCVLWDQAAGMDDGVNVVTARVYNHRAPPYPTSRVKNGWDMTREAIKKSSIHLEGVESAHFAGRGGGYTFWGVEEYGTVLAIHELARTFSHFHLPEHVRESHDKYTFRFVDDFYVYTDRVMLRVVSLIGEELRVFAKRKHDDGTKEWVHEKSVCLPEATRGLLGRKECYFRSTAKIVAAGKGYVVLTPAEETWLFSVELRTMKVERELKHVRDRLAGQVYPYELQTRPKVNSCMVDCKRSRRVLCRDFCKCK